MTNTNPPAGRTGKIIYWIATGLLAFGMLVSGLKQIFHAKEMVDVITPLGYPYISCTSLVSGKYLE